MQKGQCAKFKKFYGMVTISDKGQIAIPTELRKDLGIEKGSKLIIIKRCDGNGINLLKSNMIDQFLDEMAKD